MSDGRRHAGWRSVLGAALLLGGGPAAARDGNADGIKIATWNLEWLTSRRAGDPALPADVAPKRDEDVSTLAAYAARLDPAVAALEEVDDPALLARIFPPERYRILLTHDDVPQRVALAVRRDIPAIQHLDLATLDVGAEHDGNGHRLRSGLDATVVLGGREVRMLAVHLKSGCWGERLDDPRAACRELAEQLPVLADWIDNRRRDGAPFVVLGDFNRRFLPGDPFLAALRQAAPLRAATEGRSSPCWGGEEFIDHILAGNAAAGWMRPDTLRVMVFRETDPAMKERLSDHCPVSVRLAVPVSMPGSAR